jgi:signal transduction histidine kinase
MVTPADLRKVDALSDLSDAQLQWLIEQGEEHRFPNGSILSHTGDPADRMLFLLEGALQVRSEGDGVDGPVYFLQSGRVSGALPFSRMTLWPSTAWASGDVHALAFPKSKFPELYTTIPELIPKLVATLTDRVRESAKMTTQSEKLAALGKLSAGLAHELNNPAAAVGRAAETARQVLKRMQLTDLTCQGDMSSLDALTRSDREDDIANWLDEQGVAEAWDLAPVFVDFGWTRQSLLAHTAQWPAESRAARLTHAANALHLEDLLAQIHSASSRISDLVSAIKDYSYMDRAQLVETDVHHGLDTTLKIFASRIRQGVQIEKDYDRSIPLICAHVGQLNQVWTNLFDNALDAIADYKERSEAGRLHIRTFLDPKDAVVEITDNGAGIPQQVAPRIFDPFYTTKVQGEGTGLGLDTVYQIIRQHKGNISFQSVPGKTTFTIRLPLRQSAPAKA